MNEVKKLKRAKLYMDKLSVGVDPNTGICLNEDDIVRDSRVIACFEYISSVLEREIEVIENGGQISKKPKKVRTFITDEQFSDLKLNYGECKVSDIANEINRVIEPNNSKKLQASWINDWLESIGMICKNAEGRRVSTSAGGDIGISSHLKVSQRGTEYYLNLYSIQAQSFIFDNLRAIIEYHYENK